MVPSVSYLRNNEWVHNEVKKCLEELRNLNESDTKGRAVKKSVDWAHKTRPTYDDLTITQWVFRFVWCMHEEKSEQSRTCMLDYLGNIMEDAFSWDSAKACHAVVLTNVEANRLNWTDTDKIDHIHCAHAQRHTSRAQTSASCSVVKKNKTPYSKNGVICRYFQEASCKYPSHHKTYGQFYRQFL